MLCSNAYFLPFVCVLFFSILWFVLFILFRWYKCREDYHSVTDTEARAICDGSIYDKWCPAYLWCDSSTLMTIHILPVHWPFYVDALENAFLEVHILGAFCCLPTFWPVLTLPLEATFPLFPSGLFWYVLFSIPSLTLGDSILFGIMWFLEGWYATVYIRYFVHSVDTCSFLSDLMEIWFVRALFCCAFVIHSFWSRYISWYCSSLDVFCLIWCIFLEVFVLMEISFYMEVLPLHLLENPFSSIPFSLPNYYILLNAMFILMYFGILFILLPLFIVSSDFGGRCSPAARACSSIAGSIGWFHYCTGTIRTVLFEPRYWCDDAIRSLLHHVVMMRHCSVRYCHCSIPLPPIFLFYVLLFWWVITVLEYVRCLRYGVPFVHSLLFPVFFVFLRCSLYRCDFVVARTFLFDGVLFTMVCGHHSGNYTTFHCIL